MDLLIASDSASQITNRSVQMRVKTTIRVLLSVAAVGAALAGRSWLLSGGADDADDLPVQLRLSAEFDPLLASVELIRPLHELKRPVQSGDWLEAFPEEGGQSFRHYVQSRSRKPLHVDFAAIDIQPLGEFDETERQIVERTAEFMGHFFGMPVRQREPEPMPEIPETSLRIRNGTQQVLSTWIMNDVLKPQRRPDAIATIGLVTCDLWPGDLNWVFGQASMKDRVGVWSLHRNGDPRLDEAAFRLCLRRTLKTAVHETGHMLGIPHCIAFECCMNGSRNRAESDRQPLEFCPECQPKIWWSCDADPVQRCQSLSEFCQREGLEQDAQLFRREWDVLAGR